MYQGKAYNKDQSSSIPYCLPLLSQNNHLELKGVIITDSPILLMYRHKVYMDASIILQLVAWQLQVLGW